MAITCTPNDLLAYEGCTSCLSDSDLMAVLALLLYHVINGSRATVDPKTLQEDSNCFECLSDHQMLTVLVNIFYQFAVEESYIAVGDLRTEAACLACLPPKQIKAILLSLVCGYVQSQQS